DLEDKAGWRKSRLLERRPHFIHEALALELLGGNIHTDPEGARGRERILPAPPVPTRLSDHPGPDREDEAGLLRQRHKLERRDHAALRVVPAQQPLEPVHPARMEPHYLIEDQTEFLATESV